MIDVDIVSLNNLLIYNSLLEVLTKISAKALTDSKLFWQFQIETRRVITFNIVLFFIV